MTDMQGTGTGYARAGVTVHDHFKPPKPPHLFVSGHLSGLGQRVTEASEEARQVEVAHGSRERGACRQ
jgi:hypothetical protein